MPVDQAWVAECGGCHQPFHPSLLPRASWAALMNGLDDHFGEDASLPEAKARPIAAFLNSYAAEAWDTEAARRFAVVSLPNRCGSRRRHLGSQARGAAARAVQRTRGTVQGQCSACHTDAASGRFDDQAIRLPQPTAPGANP